MAYSFKIRMDLWMFEMPAGFIKGEEPRDNDFQTVGKNCPPQNGKTISNYKDTLQSGIRLKKRISANF
jgi:hypothetical protein